MPFVLNNADDTMELGRMLAEAMTASPVRALYLYADLGGGKTTLTRGFVSALPGGERAEVASPSFTLCNVYPTQPEILHADLYRLSEGASMPEEMEEMLEEAADAMEDEYGDKLRISFKVTDEDELDDNFVIDDTDDETPAVEAADKTDDATDGNAEG